MGNAEDSPTAGRDRLGLASPRDAHHGTDRLQLRMWTLDDFEAFAAMTAEPEVARFTAPEGKPLSRFDEWRSLCAQVGHWHLRGFGMFAVVERASAFTTLNRPHVMSLIHPDNLRSIRVAERVGEQLKGEATLPLPESKVLQYGLSREEWRRRRASGSRSERACSNPPRRSGLGHAPDSRP